MSAVRMSVPGPRLVNPADPLITEETKQVLELLDDVVEVERAGERSPRGSQAELDVFLDFEKG